MGNFLPSKTKCRVITIYNKNGTELLTTVILDSSERKRSLMGDNHIKLDFNTVDYIDIPNGSYIIYKDEKFEKMTKQMPEHSNGGWSYSIQFNAVDGHLKRFMISYMGANFKEMSFALTSELTNFAKVLIECINRELDTTKWEVGSIDDNITASKTISFKGETIFDACTLTAETFETEWYITQADDRIYINFGKLEIGESIDFIEGDIISDMRRNSGDNSKYGTRFFCFGSTKNLTEKYGEIAGGSVINQVSEIRLRLPNGMQYIDAIEGLEESDRIDKLVFFDDIYPINTDTVTSVEAIQRNDNGTPYTAYIIKADHTPFVPDDMIEGTPLLIKFTSRALQGREFNVHINKDWDYKFEIIPTSDGNAGSSEMKIPNEYMKPVEGDTFVLTGIKLPQVRINEAEQRLLEVANSYITKNSKDTDVYDCSTNRVKCGKEGIEYELGQRVKLIDIHRFGTNGRESRIQEYTKKIHLHFDASYQVGDNAKYSRLDSIENQTSDSTYSTRIGVYGDKVLNIIKSTDYSDPSDLNVYSALKTKKLLEDKAATKHDHANQDIRPAIFIVPKTISDEQKEKLKDGEQAVINSATETIDLQVLQFIKYDAENNSIKSLIDFCGDKEVSAGGAGSGSGSGVVYNRLDSFTDYTPDKAGWVTSAFLGNELHIRVKALEDVGFAPSAHIHAITDITGLSSKLDSKAHLDHTHSQYLTSDSLSAYALKADLHSHTNKSILDGINADNIHTHSNKTLIDEIETKHLLTDGQRAVLNALSVVTESGTNFLKSTLSFFSDLEVSAGGTCAGSGGDIMSYNRLDSFTDYTSDKATYVLGAAPGYDLHLRVNALNSEIDGKAAMNHVHTIANITGLQGALDGKQVAGNYALSASLTDYLLKTGGTLSGRLDINVSDEGLRLKRADVYYPQIGFENSTGFLGEIGVISTGSPAYYNPTVTRWDILYHAGNSNHINADWTCSSLILHSGVQANKIVDFLNDGAAQGLNIGSLLVSDNYGDRSLVPTNGIYTVGDIFTRGYLQSSKFGNTVTIGSQNSVFSHISNSANIPFIFNNNVHVIGDFYGGSGYNRRLAYVDEVQLLNRASALNPLSIKTTATTSGVKIRLPFSVLSHVMISFTVRLYQSYEFYDIQFSGYLYLESNNWYSPKAIMASGSLPISVKMGKDVDGKAYVWLSGGNYTSVSVFNVTSGYIGGDATQGWEFVDTTNTPDMVFNQVIFPPYSPHNSNTPDVDWTANLLTANRIATGYDSGIPNTLNCASWLYTQTGVFHTEGHYFSNVEGYLNLSSAGNEICINSGTATMQVNYRHGAKTAPTDWYWRAGSSTSMANFYLGSLSATDMTNTGWYRSLGETGWFSQDYGGGIYMTDNTYVRIYNSKKFLVSNSQYDSIYTDGGVSAIGYNMKNTEITYAGLQACRTITSSYDSRDIYLYNNQGIRIYGRELNIDTGTIINGDLSISGNMYASGEVSAGTTSDIRLKTNRKPLENATKFLKRLNPISFDYNERYFELNPHRLHKHSYGFQAQDWEEMKELQCAIRPIFKDYKCIEDKVIIPWLVKGFQEEYLRVDYIVDEVAALKKRIENLEYQLNGVA